MLRKLSIPGSGKIDQAKDQLKRHSLVTAGFGVQPSASLSVCLSANAGDEVAPATEMSASAAAFRPVVKADGHAPVTTGDLAARCTGAGR